MEKPSVDLIFLISLPRSGSTLLERMLSASKDIASVGESWFMLSLWAMRERSVARATYSHQTAVDAVNELVDWLPNKDDTYHDLVRTFALGLYGNLVRERRFFLDKTPRYYLIIDFIRRLFPDARFIYLLRNPLATLASIIDTWYHGHFMWCHHWIDWIEGYQRIASAVRQQHPREYVIRYEDLIDDPESVLKDLCVTLQIKFSSEMVANYKQRDRKSRLGDPIGIHAYSSVSDEPLSKWAQTFGSAYRKRAALRMLDLLRKEDMSTLGYEIDDLKKTLRDSPVIQGVDLRSRVDGIANKLLTTFDYPYLNDRFRMRRQGRFYFERT